MTTCLSQLPCDTDLLDLFQSVSRHPDVRNVTWIKQCETYPWQTVPSCLLFDIFFVWGNMLKSMWLLFWVLCCCNSLVPKCMVRATDATYDKIGTWEPARKQSNNCLITCHIKETQIKNQFDSWCIKSKKILATMAYLPKGCAIILFIFNWFYFWKLQCLFPCNSAMLGGSLYKQFSHFPTPVVVISLSTIEQPCHTLGGPLTKPYQNLWLCNEVKPTGQ